MTGASGGGSGSDFTGCSVSGLRFVVSAGAAGAVSGGGAGGEGRAVLSAEALSDARSLLGVHAPTLNAVVKSTIGTRVPRGVRMRDSEVGDAVGGRTARLARRT